MDSAKQQLLEKLKSANNVLITVSRNPSVDQLAALLGLSLILNKQGKHCAAVFSGQVPSTIDFLKPEETFEKNTDSLRDFIIALDKSKADKLRYKVEDNIVRIFITPYRTSITQEDLDFSQGDFNVDLLIALGVSQQTDLDDAITAHGRILHDAVVATINIVGQGDLGTINWISTGASCLSEAVTDLCQSMGDKVLDNQIATALLTGIVAETDRFRNEKTSSQTMSISAKLMDAGANQQLIASKLEEEAKDVVNINELPEVGSEAAQGDNGTLQINHGAEPENPDAKPEAEPVNELPEPDIAENIEEPEDKLPQEDLPDSATAIKGDTKMVTQPPSLGGTLTANSVQDGAETAADPFTMPKEEAPQILERKETKITPSPDTDDVQPVAEPIQPLQPPPQATNPPSSDLTPPPLNWQPPAEPNVEESEPVQDANVPQLHIDEEGTLSQIEQRVHSPHLSEEKEQKEDADVAREAVTEALKSSSNEEVAPPIEALNAQPLGQEITHEDSVGTASTAPPVPPPLNLNPPTP